jgi:phosphoribosylanthranilate isomerase
VIVRVKICGITNWTDAKLAVDLGADALGFNFYPLSPRGVTPAKAWDIIRRLPPGVAAVGVFVNWPADVVKALARAVQLTAVQLHGAEPPQEVRELGDDFRVIKAFAARPEFRLATLKRYTQASAFLLDGFRAGLHGGTGRTIDWRLGRQANAYGRVILAGGINPENVARAIDEARPFAVDVASGVETRPGKKDARALRALMREVESANSSLRREQDARQGERGEGYGKGRKDRQSGKSRNVAREKR